MKCSGWCCWAGVLLAASLAAQDEFNVEDLPREEIVLPGGGKTYNVRYLNRPWHEVDTSILQTRNMLESQDVCFEGKFDILIKTEVKLLGVRGRIVCQDPQRLRFMESLKRGDNVWICGTLRPKPGDQNVELALVEVKRLQADLPRFERRFDLYKQKSDAGALEDLGHRISKLLNSKIHDFNQHDQFVALRTKTWTLSLALRKRELAANDAEGLYNLAVKTYDLLRRTHEYHEMIRQVLAVDPNHPQASRVARDEMDMFKIGGRWMTHDEHEKMLAEQAQQVQQTEAAQKEAFERKRQQREAAARERQRLLSTFLTALRTPDVKATEGALRSLGEAVRDTPDPIFGRMGVDVLAHFDDPASIKPGLDLAVRCDYSEVRRDALEALAWRGDEAALATLADALKREQDTDTARSGIEALVRHGGKPACAALMAGLEAENQRVGSEVVEGLKTLTGQTTLTTREEWERWWQENRERADLNFAKPPGQ